MRLTAPKVANLKLPPRKSETIVFDDAIPGFGVRLRDGGSRKWIFQYKLGDKHRRMTLGDCSAIDAAAARNSASTLYARVKLGEDPAGAKVENRTRASETFGECVTVYLDWQKPQVRPKTFVDIERHLRKNLAPLHGLHIAKVDRRAIAIQLGRIAASAPTQANRTRASLSHFLGWAMGEGLVEVNHAEATNKVEEGAARDRHLNNAELRALWQALPAGDYGDIVRLLLLTGQRAREIADLAWTEIDLKRAVLELAPERTKNHRRHSVPLSGAALAVLKSRPRGDRTLVFGERVGGFSGWSKAKAQLDVRLKIPEWRIHDLRRTTATGMAELGVQPHVIEAVLNHVSGSKAGVAGIYNRASYEAEKRRALELWANHVEQIAAGHKAKIVPIKRNA